MEKTSNILKKYLKKMNQVELSKKIGVTPQYINNIINDIKSPSEKFLYKFYEVLHVEDEDKEKIRRYEELKKLPENIRKELLIYREESRKNKENIKIKYVGKLYNEYLELNNIVRYNIFPKCERYYEKNEEKLFCIKLKSQKYEPILFENSILIFDKNYEIKKNKNDKFLLNEIYIIKIKDNIKIKKIAKIEENYILQSLKSDEIEVIKVEECEILGELIGIFKYL